ncbi:MAG: hypothetical protein ACRD17_14965 [Terriglobales bacterium]
MPPPPTPGPSSSGQGQDWAVTYGSKVAAGVRSLESQVQDWKTEGREWLRLGQRFLRDIQQPSGRQRHMLALLALAAALGLVAGFVTGRRRED